MPLIVALALAGAPPARARDTDRVPETAGALKTLSLEQLFDLEVTSVSKKPEALSRTAAAIHVVTREDLRLTGARSIPEALRYVPGVEVARVDSRQYAVTARGFNGTVANKLLVLMDGRSVYTPLFSGVFWDVQDAFMEDIEQIEVIRGPGATVWGANAVNGVINVRSRDAAETQGWLVTGGAGNTEQGFGGARYGGRLGSDGHFRVYGKHVERAASLDTNGDPAGDALRMSQGGFRFDRDGGGRDRISVQGDLYGGSVDQRGTSATEFEGGNVLASWRRRISATADLEVAGYFDRARREIPLTFGQTLDTYDIALRHRFSHAERHDVTWGAGYRRMEDDVRNSAGLAFLPARVTQHLFSCFVQDELSAFDGRLRFTAGSKFEHNAYTGFEYQPGLHAAYTPSPSHTVWAGASRAVRAPSRIDRDFYVPRDPPHMLAGGPGFDSEILRALELGWKASPAASLTGSIAAFYHFYDRLRSVETGSPATLANGLEAETRGVEIELRCQLADAWRVSAGHTYIDIAIEPAAGSTDTSGHRMAGDSPRHQSFVRSSLAVSPELTLSAHVRAVGRLENQNVPAYVTGGARLGWRPAPGLELEIVGQDLFDPRHREFGGGASRREVERSWHGKATWTF